jgi:hypothetical protein
MSGSGDRWADLSSQNERVIQLTESTAGSAGCLSGVAQSQWAALASQRERLVNTTDPEFGVAGSRHASSGRSFTSMRLVAGAA